MIGRNATVSGNGTVSTYAYDNASRLTGLTQDLSGGAANDQTYGFTYTAASQISQRTAANDNYNWTGPNVSRMYNRNGLNQYTSVGGTNFAYDARGNLTSDGSGTFAYDLENRLLSVSGSASLALAYDPLGRLRSTTAAGSTTEFLYDGDRLVAEYDGSGNVVRRYVHGPGVDEPVVWYEGSGLTDRRWLAADHQGSIIATNDNAGATTIQSYGPYGEPLNWSGSRFRYTGQMALPEVQLYHYRARVYDPVLGRFLQTDPIGYEDDVNLYAYVANDPLNSSDPSGLIDNDLQFDRLHGIETPQVMAPVTNEIISTVVDMIPIIGDIRGGIEFLQNPTIGGAIGMAAGAIGLDAARGPIGNAVDDAVDGLASTLRPGPHAAESIPARGPQRDFTPTERSDTNRIMGETGCHTCGTRDPGTVSGNAIPDHQPPSALNRPGGEQRLLPHCRNCSDRQMREVRQEQLRRRRQGE